MNTETMYIYQPTQDSKQKQEQNEKPSVNCKLETKETLLDALAREVLIYNLFEDNSCLKAEQPITEDLYNFCKWQNVPTSGDEYDILLAIIYEYQKTAFKAGFRTAQQLLK